MFEKKKRKIIMQPLTGYGIAVLIICEINCYTYTNIHFYEDFNHFFRFMLSFLDIHDVMILCIMLNS